MIIAIVVDSIITGEDSNLFYEKRCTLYINQDKGTIENIIEGNPGSIEYDKLITFPNYTTLLPGFIDCHVHLTIATDDYQIDHLKLSSADKSLRALKAAQGLQKAGFTTLRSAGDADNYYPTFAVSKSINNKDFDGPRIVGAGHYISVTGGGGDINFFSSDNCLCCKADGIIADGKHQMIKAVRNEIKYGSDWIKILATGAFMSSSTGPKDSPENTHMSTEEIETCVIEAKRRQVRVMAHAHGAEGIAIAANAGVRSIEHASFIDDVGIEACLRNNTWIVPTFLIGAYFDDVGSVTGAQDRMIQLAKDNNERYYNCIQNAVKKGVKVALGSDYVGWNPSITAREFRYMCEHANMSTLQSIQAGTSSAAEMLEISNIGYVKEGFLADLVIVVGDPIKNIELLEKSLVFVMQNGKIIRHDK